MVGELGLSRETVLGLGAAVLLVAVLADYRY